MTLPVPKYTKDEVRFLKELIEAGEYRAVIDRTYRLEDVVRRRATWKPVRRLGTCQKTGNVVLIVIG